MVFPFVKKVRRALGLPLVPAATVRRVGIEDELLYQAVCWNINKNDAALYNLLYCSRLIRFAARDAGSTLENATILEMGTSKLPGLPFVLLMQGVKKYHANNIFRVDGWMSEGYAKLIAMTFAGFVDDVPARLREIIEWEEGPDGKPRARLRPERFENHSPVPAEDIELLDASVDAAFSLSVLEHVKQPAAVITNGFRMLKPGGWCVHFIDLRDHRDFNDSFRFLREEDAVYEAECPRGENRLRASDWFREFASAGYEILGVHFADDPIPLDEKGRTDIAGELLTLERQLDPADSLEKRTPRITEAERDGFVERFRRYSLADLSQEAITVVARKPR